MARKREDPRILRRKRRGRQRRFGKRAHNPNVEYFVETVQYRRRGGPGSREGLIARIQNKVERATLSELYEEGFDLEIRNDPNRPTLSERIEAVHQQEQERKERLRKADWKTWFAGMHRQVMVPGVMDMIFSGEEFRFIKYEPDGSAWVSACYFGLKRARQVFALNDFSWVERLPAAGPHIPCP